MLITDWIREVNRSRIYFRLIVTLLALICAYNMYYPGPPSTRSTTLMPYYQYNSPCLSPYYINPQFSGDFGQDQHFHLTFCIQSPELTRLFYIIYDKTFPGLLEAWIRGKSHPQIIPSHSKWKESFGKRSITIW